MSKSQHYLNVSLSGSQRFDDWSEFDDYLLKLYRVDRIQKYLDLNTKASLLFVKDDNYYPHILNFGNFDRRKALRDMSYSMIWGSNVNSIRHDIIHFDILDENGDDVLFENYVDNYSDVRDLLVKVMNCVPNHNKSILLFYRLDEYIDGCDHSNVIHRILLDDDIDEENNCDINTFEQYSHLLFDLNKLDERNNETY